MRAVKMKFIEATIRLLVVNEVKHEDVFAVEQWVLMSQNTVTVNTRSTKRKFGEDGLPNETTTTTQPSTPSMKTPTQNSTTITPKSNTIPSTYDCHSLSQKFPILSSFNPVFLRRGRRLVNGVDLDCQLVNGMIDETVRLCAKLNKP
jgi:hypothetical protein